MAKINETRGSGGECLEFQTVLLEKHETWTRGPGHRQGSLLRQVGIDLFQMGKRLLAVKYNLLIIFLLLFCIWKTIVKCLHRSWQKLLNNLSNIVGMISSTFDFLAIQNVLKQAIFLFYLVILLPVFVVVHNRMPSDRFTILSVQAKYTLTKQK